MSRRAIWTSRLFIFDQTLVHLMLWMHELATKTGQPCWLWSIRLSIERRQMSTSDGTAAGEPTLAHDVRLMHVKGKCVCVMVETA